MTNYGQRNEPYNVNSLLTLEEDKPYIVESKKIKEREYGNEAEHTKNKRGSTKTKHEEGQTRKMRDKGGEKGDKNRKRYK